MIETQTLRTPGATFERPSVRWTPRAIARRLEGCGLSPSEASNLTARLEGLRSVRTGWSLPEVERLLFLRWLVEDGRLARADDRALPDEGGFLALGGFGGG